VTEVVAAFGARGNYEERIWKTRKTTWTAIPKRKPGTAARCKEQSNLPANGLTGEQGEELLRRP